MCVDLLSGSTDHTRLPPGGRQPRALVSLTYDDVRRATSVDERELVEALRLAGSDLFTKMKDLCPQNAAAYDDALARLMGRLGQWRTLRCKRK